MSAAAAWQPKNTPLGVDVVDPLELRLGNVEEAATDEETRVVHHHVDTTVLARFVYHRADPSAFETSVRTKSAVPPRWRIVS